MVQHAPVNEASAPLTPVEGQITVFVLLPTTVPHGKEAISPLSRPNCMVTGHAFHLTETICVL